MSSFNDVVPLASVVNPEADPCTETCEQISYDRQISNAGLSVFSISTILAIKQDQLIENKRKASDVQVRVNKEDFYQLLSALFAVKINYYRFLEEMKEETSHIQSRLVTPVVNSIKALYQVFNTDFHHILFGNMKNIVKLFDMVYEPTRSVLYNKIEKVIRHAHYVTIYVNGVVPQAATQTDNITRVLEEMNDNLDVINYILPKYYTMLIDVPKAVAETIPSVNISALGPLPERLIIPSNNCSIDLEKFMHESIEFYSATADVLSSYTHNLMSDILKTNYTIMVQIWGEHYSRLRHKCLDAFYNLIQDVRSLTNSIDLAMEIQTDLEYTFDYESAISAVLNDAKWFTSLADSYVRYANITKYHLQSNFTDGIVNDMIDNVLEVTNDVKFRVTERLRTDIDNSRQSIVEWYKSILNVSFRMSVFIGNETMKNRTQDMKIWDSPVPLIHGYNNCSCYLKMSKSTDPNDCPQSLEEAYHDAAVVVNNFFDKINDNINDYDESLDAVEVNLTTVIEGIGNLMSSYRISDEPDSKFVL